MKSPGFSVGFLVLYWVNCCFINENYCSIGYIYVHSPVPRDTPQKKRTRGGGSGKASSCRGAKGHFLKGIKTQGSLVE